MSAMHEARSTRMSHWNDSEGVIHFPIDPYKIAKNLGIDVRTEALEPNVSGFIVKEPGKPTTAVINSNDFRERQRFTLAHEIGHYVSHKDEDSLGFVDYRDELASTGASPEERWANGFAAELLMPAAAVTKWWASGDTFEEIKQRLDVSKAALRVRLSSLGLVR